jgi:hypothetical protein
MARFALLLMMLIVGLHVFAGSGTAKLTCTSASGRTTFTADLQDIQGMFEGAVLTIDGSTLRFPGEGNRTTSAIIWDPANGVFTVSYLRPGDDDFLFLRFWAVPSTFKTISDERGSAAGAVYTFDAIIEASEPRDGGGPSTPTIRLSCRLEYKI